MKDNLHARKPINKAEKKSPPKKKLHLRGKLIRIPGNDKGKVVIKPNFDAPLPEFDLLGVTKVELMACHSEP